MKAQRCLCRPCIYITGSLRYFGLHTWREDKHVQVHCCHHALRRNEVQAEAKGRAGWSWWICWY